MLCVAEMYLENRNVHIADVHFRTVPLCFPFAIQKSKCRLRAPFAAVAAL